MVSDDSVAEQFIARLPKVELHAHLSGCIRESTLIDLARERNIALSDTLIHAPSMGESSSCSRSPANASDNNVSQYYNKRPRSLSECFLVFEEIARAVNDLPALERVTREALEDLAASHVVYAEIRTTPKQLLRHYSLSPNMHEFLGSNGSSSVGVLATKRDYLETVLRVMRDFQPDSKKGQDDAHDESKLTCRLIVAMDRSLTLEEARENVELAIAMRSQHKGMVVGMDLGGNPLRGSFHEFRPLLEQARHAGLYITLHCAEVPCDEKNNHDYFMEAKSMLEFAPDRLGHALLLPPKLQAMLIQKRIPVEICPTSNVMTLELHKHVDRCLVQGLRHHSLLKEWLSIRQPMAVCTDDPGVFHTDATKELILLQKAMNLSLADIVAIVSESMDLAFCADDVKQEVKLRMLKEIEMLRQNSRC